MTLKDFVATPQVLVSAGGEVRGGIDEALASAGHQRRVVLSTPSFLALPRIVETTDLVGVLPERLALRLSAAAPLTAFELPIDVEPMTCSMLALAPIAKQPEMLWLLDRIRFAFGMPRAAFPRKGPASTKVNKSKATNKATKSRTAAR